MAHNQLWVIYAAATAAFTVFFNPAATIVIPSLVECDDVSPPTRRGGRP